MEKISRELLIKDICSRLPYGVYVKFQQYDNPLFLHMKGALVVYNGGEMIDAIQYLYLRPMSSMTAEEEYEYHRFKNIDYLEICEMEHTKMLETTALCFSRATDWLDKNGFDYRGLIPMGLALEAKEGMYKTK